MLAVIKNFRNKKLSTQINLTYGVILLSAVVLTNVGATAGIYYLFHHQAERAIDISVEKVIQRVNKLQAIDENFFEINMLPSVIFRVTDETGETIFDSNPYFAPTEKMLQLVRNNPPFWSSSKYILLETSHSFFYYKDLPLEVGGKIFHFHFLRTITFEKQYIRYLLWTLFLADLIGLGLALMTGNVLGKKLLKPLKQVTKTAREISIGTMNKRLTVENSGEEVNELSLSLNTMLDRLEKSFAQQQRFIADASHELRTPITVIRGYADMLEKYGADDKEILEEATIEIKKSAQNMQYLVENLLFLARADAGTQPLHTSPVEINEVLKVAVENFKNPRIEFVDDKIFEMIGDAEFLKKMFAAFIDNALIYSNDKVFVTLENFGTRAVVEISDKGIGIAPENLDKIFDRFFKGDKARVKVEDDKISAGLGLSIAKWIADNHDVKIEVASKLGKGTTFKLTFNA
ncbi:MAG: HAMP domain-containing histidine kinase [Selenomonadaceae bacterium]|nr:HAMP domain-containing histidine kinase [Selenomonadaceae bacterium]